MTDRELLLTVVDEIKSMRTEFEQKFDKIDQKFDKIEQRLDVIEENTAITREATNSLVEWADDVGVITSVKFPVKKAE